MRGQVGGLGSSLCAKLQELQVEGALPLNPGSHALVLAKKARQEGFLRMALNNASSNSNNTLFKRRSLTKTNKKS